jgi:hypothetical protein
MRVARRRFATMSHPSRDKAAARMGHPILTLLELLTAEDAEDDDGLIVEVFGAALEVGDGF